jgi:hypothetical protein
VDHEARSALRHRGVAAVVTVAEGRVSPVPDGKRWTAADALAAIGC